MKNRDIAKRYAQNAVRVAQLIELIEEEADELILGQVVRKSVVCGHVEGVIGGAKMRVVEIGVPPM